MGFFRIVGGLILAFLAIGLVGAIFQTGYLAGVAGGAGPAAAGPAYGWGWGWGFGGGLVHFLGFIFFILIFFALLRAIFGGHRRHWGPGSQGWGRGWGPDDHGHPGAGMYGPWEDRARQMHDEWHRRNDPSAAPSADRPSTVSGGPDAMGPTSGGAPTGGNPA